MGTRCDVISASCSMLAWPPSENLTKPASRQMPFLAGVRKIGMTQAWPSARERNSTVLRPAAKSRHHCPRRSKALAPQMTLRASRTQVESSDSHYREQVQRKEAR